MANELDVKVIIPRLDEQKKRKLLDIFEDYEVVDEEGCCLKLKSG